ncbi:MAG: ABC transporter ATP-binding protein [Tissierellia bacterium]|nr:ABC transporter ATP-binding protein [Tissierellia bacterium]
MNKKKKKEPSVLQRLKPFMGKKQILFPLSLILAGVSSVVGVLPFIYIRKVIVEILESGKDIDVKVVSNAALYALLFAVFAILIYFIALLLSHLAAFRVEIGFQKVAMERILKMPLGFYDYHSSGKIRKIVNDGATITHSFLAHNLPDLASAIITPIIILVLMYYIDWRLASACMIPLLFGFIIVGALGSIGKQFQQMYFDSLEEMSAESVEYVRAIPVVKTFGQSIHSFERFYKSIITYRDMVLKYTLSWHKPYCFYLALIQGAAFFLIPFAILLLGRGWEMNKVLADFIFYLIISPTIIIAMMRIMYLNQNKMIAKQAIDRLDQLLSTKEMVYKDKEINLKSYDITFQDVEFEYEGAGRNAIDGISFQVKDGESVALVGMSGSGKTTIARLIPRFWDVKSGKITIGGVNVKDIPREELMNLISFVFQNTRLFKMTLRDNIVFGKKDYTKEELDQAIRLSQSQDIIDALPNGLDTIIGSQGTYLSGGEQQRIALARGILKDAPIVLLDEATAFADPENESLIQNALKELSKGKTSIMIAHRLTSVVDADRIFVIDQGKIIQSGTHEELIHIEGQYKKMWEDYQKSVHWKIKKGETYG